MHLPGILLARLDGYALEPVRAGESGAAVWRCTSTGARPGYLKAAELESKMHLDREAERLRWMAGRQLAVPAVREYGCVENVEYLLLDEVTGLAASDSRWRAYASEVALALGVALRRLHRVSVAECPFDARIAGEIEEARDRVARGLVREDEFDDVRAGRGAADLLSELVASVPPDEDLVVTHGDFTLPNVILDRSAGRELYVSGLVDCGRVGIADRYRDLALASRSITHELGIHALEPFLEGYGLPLFETAKMAFYALLDEFF
jgi:aminoglycoside 3'-phosphotransferase-2